MAPNQKTLTITIGAVLDRCTKPPSSSTIEAVWIALRRAHPMLGSIIVDDGFIYTIPTSNDLQRWAEETIYIDTSGKTGRDLALSSSNLKNAELYFLPNHNEVFLRLRHELIDGVGSFMLFNELLRLLQGKPLHESSNKPENVINQLGPSLMQLACATIPEPESMLEVDRIAKDANAPTLGLMNRPQDIQIPMEYRRLEYSLNEADTLKLLKICKENQITITAASTVATSRVLLKHNGLESGTFGESLIVSLRDTLVYPYNGPRFAVSNRITAKVGIFSFSLAENFSKTARAIKREYASWKSNKVNVAAIGPITEAMLNAGQVNATKTKIAGPDFSPIGLSSLGIVENYISQPIDDFWFSVSIGGAQSTIYIYTVKDKLRFAISYNSKFHEAETIKEFMEDFFAEFKQGLGFDPIGGIYTC
ncbi:hypothetical protein TWF694_011104 [Orbilia ellipsospora]|uniref:O-acyltransferase WSD1 C-terminal domain-containing protein n=1 Tax=Orbilia ellipsospora TaxID=2528407 RepID=A0AAV9X815_9PEZI